MVPSIISTRVLRLSSNAPSVRPSVRQPFLSPPTAATAEQQDFSSGRYDEMLVVVLEKKKKKKKKKHQREQATTTDLLMWWYVYIQMMHSPFFLFPPLVFSLRFVLARLLFIPKTEIAVAVARSWWRHGPLLFLLFIAADFIGKQGYLHLTSQSNDWCFSSFLFTTTE